MSPDFEQTIIQPEKYYREFIEQNTDGILRIDFAEPIPIDEFIDGQCEMFFNRGFIAEFNNSFAQNFNLFNDNDLTNQLLSELKTTSELLSNTNIRKFFESGFRLDDFEIKQTDKTGKPKTFLVNIVGVIKDRNLVCVWGRLHDITAQNNSSEFEKYWQQTQKIEALGRLAGGIAHDFNNFLAVIMLQNDMLNLQLPANSPLRHRTAEMKKATNNAAAMVKQLLAIGRKQTLHPKPTELNNTVKEFSNFLPTLIPANIQVITNLELDLGVCFIDQQHLIQSLVNLTLNANDAMSEGGILKIETANVVLDKNSIQHKSQSEGSFVQITISDTGVGMDSTTLESVFEPFFSTKKSAKGVGLGLATVYGFVKQSKGFIWVESKLNSGTTFKIQFPRIDQPRSVENI